jgi:acyl-coenzyme A synthetase/AMP-(fatty) acid ligase
MTTTSESYRAARDFLLENRENYDKAVAEFRWPDITGTWNWATDWFDGYARGNDRTALWIVEEDGSEEKFDDPLLLYFTSGTTSKPKLVLHTHQSYPVGHLSTMYWIGPEARRRALNISSPGWAKHAWSCFFAPWNAGACVFMYNYNRFNAAALLDVLVKHEVTTLCAPPTVWRMLIQEDLAGRASRLKLRELIGAGEPLNPEVIEQVKKAWGMTIRDGFGQTETTAQIGNPPASRSSPARWAARCPATDRAARPRRQADATRARSASTWPHRRSA